MLNLSNNTVTIFDVNIFIFILFIFLN